MVCCRGAYEEIIYLHITRLFFGRVMCKKNAMKMLCKKNEKKQKKDLLFFSVYDIICEQFAVVVQLAERQLPKLNVAGSSPVYRSTNKLI